MVMRASADKPERVDHSSTIPANNARAIPVNDTVLTLVTLAAILLVYLLFPTKNYYWDGIFFARVIETAQGFGAGLLHPNHLLYNVVGYVIYRVAWGMGLQWRAIELLQVANSCVSVLTAFLVFRILRRTLQSRYLAWALTLIFAFSATWWKFSTDANAYILSVFFLLLAFNFTLPGAKSRPLLVAVLFSVATLLHQLAVIAFPVFVLALWWQSGRLEKKRRIVAILEFGILSFLLIFVTYCYCFYLLTGTTSATRFARWITSYSPDASFTFDFLSNLGYTLRGNVRLFFNARLSLLRGLLSAPIIALIALLAMALLLWLFTLIRGLKSSKPKARKKLSVLFAVPTVRLYLLWIGLYMVFLFFWLPHNTFYRLFYLPAIILLLGEFFARSNAPNRKPTYRLGLFVVMMFLSNFLFFIYPNSHTEKYPPLSLALEMNRIWQPGTVVYFQSENSDNNLVAYFNPSIEWRPVREFDVLTSELKDIYQQGRSAWLEASAIDQIRARPGGPEWIEQHAKQETWRERKARGYNVKFVQVSP
jgi:hypothetical protein